ncbi:helix-turn-helix domain-containing protein [Aurantibacillus circumpalustris]|uniref:helix-turn-helix domain-containing protein n=1 Tax=Aurantibacillus circumpalustris TaxID=3036359 RepID=UPI00295B4973|nr:AraC family transcriptional regulator [Aurantibacillus circumpalustris]
MLISELKEPKVISPRQKQIVAEYLQKLDVYIGDLKTGKEDRVLEISEFAEMMHMHPGHLSNTVKEVTGQSSCSFFEAKLVDASKELLLQENLSIKEIAIRLTYDPSNFTKFFKRFTGRTPKQFRAENL